jgi:hypothetical protein
MDIIVCFLLCNNLLINLWNHSDEEIEEYDQIDELVDKPHHPHCVDYCIFTLIAQITWLIPHPCWVIWRRNISNRISIRDKEEFYNIDNSSIILVYVIWIRLDLDPQWFVKTSKKQYPHSHEHGEWEGFNYCHCGHLH